MRSYLYGILGYRIKPEDIRTIHGRLTIRMRGSIARLVREFDSCTMSTFILGATLGLMWKTAAAQSPLVAAATIEWRSSCNGSAVENYLKMSVFTDGFVRYDGALWDGKRWLRTQRIGRANARRLLAGAKTVIKEAPTAEGYPNLPAAHCLTVAVSDKAGSVIHRASIRSDQALTFEKQIRRAVQIDPRKCSSREILPRECGGVVILFTHYEKQACGRTHVTHVYPNGVVHYYVDKVPGSDRYTHISPALITILQEHPSDAPLQEISGIESHRSYDGSYAELLRTRFESITGIEWVTFDQATKCGDQHYGPKSTITTVP